MPLNFPDAWRKRVETNITRADQAAWISTIPELDVEIQSVEPGTAGELNIIYIPVTDFEPNVLINNSSYPLALVDYTDSVVTISLDKYQTEQTSISDDAIIGAAYNKIDAATNSHTTAILKKKYAKAAHASAPASNTTATPVLVTTGDPVGTGSNKRLRLRYEDLVAFRAACVAAGFDFAGIVVLVLCDDHWQDILLDRKNFGDQMVNYKEGDVAPRLLGFTIQNYVANPSYSGTTRLAFGAVPSSTQFQGSFAFMPINMVKKTGVTRQYFSPASTDTAKQTNTLNYRTYFIVVPKRAKLIAAIASGLSA